MPCMCAAVVGGLGQLAALVGLARAAVDGDRAATAAMARRVLAATSDPADRRSQLAQAFLAWATDDPIEAARGFAAVQPSAPDAPWWRQMVTIDAIIGAALAAAATGSAPRARAYLDRAAQLAAGQLASAPILIGHRVEAIATLRDRLP